MGAVEVSTPYDGFMAAKLANYSVTRANKLGKASIKQKVTTTTRKVDSRSAVLCPVDTGRLRASGKSRVGGRGNTVVGVVRYTAAYALAVHNGRRALTIVPRNGKYLKFQVDGRTVYARSVHQPARAGRPWLTRALLDVAPGQGFVVVQAGGHAWSAGGGFA